MSSDQPQSGRFEGRTHILPVRVYYEDTDFTGLVYHASYLRFFERGRSDFLRCAGVHHNALLQGDDPTAFAVIRMEIDFLSPARIDDALTARTVFETMRGPRIFIAQELHRNSEVPGEIPRDIPGEILVRAKVEICCINLAGRPRKPPAPLLARLKPFLEPSPSSF